MSNSNLGNTGQPASADTPSAPSASSAPPASSAESAHDPIHEGSVAPREETSEPNDGSTSLSPESSELNEGSIAQSDESERDPKRTLTLSPARADAWETELRGRLGVVGRLPHTLAVQGWIAALIAGFIAFVTRFWNLAHPHAAAPASAEDDAAGAIGPGAEGHVPSPIDIIETQRRTLIKARDDRQFDSGILAHTLDILDASQIALEMRQRAGE